MAGAAVVLSAARWPGRARSLLGGRGRGAGVDPVPTYAVVAAVPVVAAAGDRRDRPPGPGVTAGSGVVPGVTAGSGVVPGVTAGSGVVPA